jgi:hypothetical protein
MRRVSVLPAVLLLVVGSVALGAELWLRPVSGDDPAELTLTRGTTAVIEIVLQLDEGEDVGFINLFLDITDDVVEGLDFQPGLPVPPGRYAGHETFDDPDDPFPWEPGDGLSLEDYALILETGGIEGPGTFVLERIVVHGRSAGEAELSFEFGGRTPTAWHGDPSRTPPYQTASPQVPPDLPGFLYIGIGDNRTGGAGALHVTVAASPDEEPNDNGGFPPPGGDNRNDNGAPPDDNDNDNAPPDNENDNAPPENGNDNAPSENDNAGGRDNANDNDDAPGGDDNTNDNAGDNVNDNGGGGTPDANDNQDGGANDNTPPSDDPANDNSAVPPAGEPNSDNANTDSGTGGPRPTRLCGAGMIPMLLLTFAGLRRTRRGRPNDVPRRGRGAC